MLNSEEYRLLEVITTRRDSRGSEAYHYTKNKTWGVEAKLYTNLTIGFMGLSKDPRVGSIAVILSVAETAGAFDPFYNEMDKLQYFSQPPAYFGGPNPR